MPDKREPKRETEVVLLQLPTEIYHRLKAHSMLFDIPVNEIVSKVLAYYYGIGAKPYIPPGLDGMEFFIIDEE